MVAHSSIIEQIIEPETGTLSPELAKYILSLDFRPDHRAKADELSAKAREGTLSPEETAELDELLYANAFLGILHSKARVSLRKHPSAA